MYKQGKKIRVFDNPVVAYHDLGGISHNIKHSKENFWVVKENFGLHYQILSWVYFKKQGLKKRLKNILSKILCVKLLFWCVCTIKIFLLLLQFEVY